MRGRGLGEPLSVVSDGAPGIIKTKVPLSIAAPWTGIGHPDNTLRTIATLMRGERREF